MIELLVNCNMQRYSKAAHITLFEERDIRINRQRSVFRKHVKAFCPVNSTYISSQGIIYCELIRIIALFVSRCAVLDCICTCVESKNHVIYYLQL